MKGQDNEQQKVAFKIPVFTFSNLYVELVYQWIINVAVVIILFTKFDEIYSEGLRSMLIFSIVFTLLDQYIKQVLIRYPKLVIYTLGLIFQLVAILLFMLISEFTESVSFSSVGVIVMCVLALSVVKVIFNYPIRNILRNKTINKIIRRLS